MLCKVFYERVTDLPIERRGTNIKYETRDISTTFTLREVFSRLSVVLFPLELNEPFLLPSSSFPCHRAIVAGGTEFPPRSFSSTPIYDLFDIVPFEMSPPANERETLFNTFLHLTSAPFPSTFSTKTQNR